MGHWLGSSKVVVFWPLQARLAVKKAGLEHKVQVVHKDAHGADVSSASIIALYLSDRGNLQLLQSIQATLRPGTKVCHKQMLVATASHLVTRIATYGLLQMWPFTHRLSRTSLVLTAGSML